MYYTEVIQTITNAKRSPFKSVNWEDKEEVQTLRQLMKQINIKEDCDNIIKTLNGLLGSWVFGTNKDDVITEQQRMIDNLCDAVAFFCALAYMLEKKIQQATSHAEP